MFTVEDLGFRIEGLGFWGKDFWFRVQGSVFRFKCLVMKV